MLDYLGAGGSHVGLRRSRRPYPVSADGDSDPQADTHAHAYEHTNFHPDADTYGNAGARS